MPDNTDRIELLNSLGKQAADAAESLRDESEQKAIIAQAYDVQAATLFGLAQELGGE